MYCQARQHVHKRPACVCVCVHSTGVCVSVLYGPVCVHSTGVGVCTLQVCVCDVQTCVCAVVSLEVRALGVGLPTACVVTRVCGDALPRPGAPAALGLGLLRQTLWSRGHQFWGRSQVEFI